MYIFMIICIYIYLKIFKYIGYKHGGWDHLPVVPHGHCKSPGLVGHHVALLWRCVTLRVGRDDEAGRQSLARRKPLALGVVQAASVAKPQPPVEF